ncbi:hypothetical protein LR48_Vigan11g110500 [Vigna angularis]|uniref:Uncharacterized protein n=1 Tax=Phaseolus angularis TaxID=3914 RepID=A0A0L9VSL8_PHAAN|nr:hypothetical protein LR48_Vigan11g110500 [Vigna angularis]
MALANWNLAYALYRSKLRAQLNGSQNENAALKLKLEEAIVAYSQCHKTNIDIPNEEFEAEVPAEEFMEDVATEGQVPEEEAPIDNEEEVANETEGQDEAANPSIKENINLCLEDL